MSPIKVKNITLFILTILIASLVNAAGLKKLSVKNNIELNYAKVTKATSGNAIFSVTYSGVNNTSGSYIPYIIDGNFLAGEIEISGDNAASNTLNITTSSCGSSSPGVALQNFSMSYEGVTWNVAGSGPYTQTNLPATPKKGAILKYGAELVVGSTANFGTDIEVCYNIEVQYDCAPTCTSDPPVIYNGIALVTIFKSVNLQTTTDMDFGTITMPIATTTYTLEPSGAIKIKAGDFQILQPASAGAGIVSAQENEDILVSATLLSAPPGLDLLNFTADYNNSGAKVIDSPYTFRAGVGDVGVLLGADLVIDPNLATEGAHTLTYLIEVSYP